jgi:hypothetical protein
MPNHIMEHTPEHRSERLSGKNAHQNLFSSRQALTSKAAGRQPENRGFDQMNEQTKPKFELNRADCDLSFRIAEDGVSGSDFSKGGHGYCWAGVRANLGIFKAGKYYFTSRITSHGEVELQNIPPEERNLARFGLSTADCPLDGLGESRDSYGFGSTGKASSRGDFRYVPIKVTK